MGKSSGGSSKTSSTLSAIQQEVEKLIGGHITEAFARGDTGLQYPEGGVPGIPQELYEGFDRYFEGIQDQSQIQETLSGLLRGDPAYHVDPEMVSSQFTENVAGPAMDIFATEVQPIIEEQYGGDFYSSRRRNAVTQSALVEQAKLRQQLFQAQMFSQQLNAQSAENAAGRQPGAVAMAQQLPFQQFQQTAGVTGTTQGAEVDYFNRMMQAQVQTSEASSPWFQAAQQFIQKPNMETVVQQGGSPWYQSGVAGVGAALALNAMMPGAGAAAGGGGLFPATMGTAAQVAWSDERFKQNIEPYEGNALEVLKGINTKRFEFISSPTNKEVGVIAQEVEKVLPEAVTELCDKKFVNTLTLVAVVIKAINELQKKIGD